MVLRIDRVKQELITADDINNIANDVNTAVARTDRFGGGLAGQVPVKNSDAPYDVTWQTMGGGGSGSGGSTVYTVASSTTPLELRSNATYVCDGTADQEEIQAAHDALPASGGYIQLLAGNYNITAPIRISKHGTVLAGSGMASVGNASQLALGTRLTVVTGFSGTAVVLVQTVANDVPVSSVSLKEFTIDGADIVGGQHGIMFKAHTSDISRVRVARMTGNGINVEGYTTWAAYDTILSRCYTTDNLGAGIYLGSQDAHVFGCISYGNDGAGIHIKGASQQITNCHTYSNKYGIWFDNNGSRTKVVNVKVEQSVQHGIYFDNTTAGTSNVIISACNFKNNGQSANNTYDQIYFSNNSTASHQNAMVTGCSFSVASPAGGFLPRYNLNAASSATNGLNVSGCVFSGTASVGTAAMNVASTAIVTCSGNSFGTGATGKDSQRGKVSVASGGTIAIALARVPTYYEAHSTVAGHTVAVTAATATALTISITDAAGAAVTTAENVTYSAEI